MINNVIDIDGKWKIRVFYNIKTPELNQGFTYTNFKKKESVVVIGKTSNPYQFYNTVVHEAKHVQSAICKYYNIAEDSEDAAYLIGYVVM
jgi:hypothetical protein